MATKVRAIEKAPGILQLHIELRGTKPKVWRRVLVPETITLIKLHLVIQAAFGWEHSHLHEFIARDGQRYGTLDPDYDDPGSVTSERTRLTTALRTTPTLSYLYDFGDSWDHRIKVEKRLLADPVSKLPFCVGGAGATPPEDCGGTPGYEELVRVMVNPNDPEHAQLATWLGRTDWDPELFNSIEANDRLDSIKL